MSYSNANVSANHDETDPENWNGINPIVDISINTVMGNNTGMMVLAYSVFGGSLIDPSAPGGLAVPPMYAAASSPPGFHAGDVTDDNGLPMPIASLPITTASILYSTINGYIPLGMQHPAQPYEYASAMTAFGSSNWDTIPAGWYYIRAEISAVDFGGTNVAFWLSGLQTLPGFVNELGYSNITAISSQADIGINTNLIDFQSIELPVGENYAVGWDQVETPGCIDPDADNYNPNATLDDGTCVYGTSIVYGCTNPAASNYDSTATEDNGTCIILGCMNPIADNYNADATQDNGSCIIPGCTDSTALNYDPSATVDNGSCVAMVNGCTNPLAFNYNPDANVNDGTCEAVVYGCIDSNYLEFNSEANTDDGTCVTLAQPGCTNPDYAEYHNQGFTANIDNGSCSVLAVFGCTHPEHYSYDSAANVLDESFCEEQVLGCTDHTSPTFNPEANTNDGSCVVGVVGCADSDATNFVEGANMPITCTYTNVTHTYYLTSGEVFDFVPAYAIENQGDLDAAIGAGNATFSFSATPMHVMSLQAASTVDLSYSTNQRTGTSFSFTSLDKLPCLSYVETSFKAWVEDNLPDYTGNVSSSQYPDKVYLGSIGMATHPSLNVGASNFEILNIESSYSETIITPTSVALTDTNGYVSDLYMGLGDDTAYVKIPSGVTTAGTAYDVIIAPKYVESPNYYPGSVLVIAASDSNKDILLPFRFVSLADFNDSTSDWYKYSNVTSNIQRMGRSSTPIYPVYNYSCYSTSGNTGSNPFHATPITGGNYSYNSRNSPPIVIKGIRVLIKEQTQSSWTTLSFEAGTGGYAATNEISAGGVYTFIIAP